MRPRTIVIDKTQTLLLAAPSCNGESMLTGAYVTPIRQGKRVLFVIQDQGEHSGLPGHEAGLCIGVLSSFQELCVGLKIEDLIFSTYYEDRWRHIRFKDFNSTLIGEAWPNYDSGAALGQAQVTDAEIILPIDDAHADLFTYWWLSQSAAGWLFDELPDWQTKGRTRRLSWGEAKYEVTDAIGARLAFASSKSLLRRRRRAVAQPLRDAKYSRVLEVANTDSTTMAYACLVHGVLSTTDHFTKLDPGVHLVDAMKRDEWLQRMLHVGGSVVSESADLVEIDLPVDLNMVDLLNVFGFASHIVMRRGRYVLALAPWQTSPCPEGEAEDGVTPSPLFEL